MMVSARKRGAVISTSVYEGFPSTCTRGRGIQLHASCIKKQIMSLWWLEGLENTHETF